MNKLRISILYSWFVRTITCFLPNHPIFMRLRGFLYSLMMRECGCNFQVSSTVILNSLSGMRVGSNVYIAPNNVFITDDIYIEDNVILGPGGVYSSGDHQFDGESFRWLPSKSKGSLIIKQGSWVAANCTITTGAILPCESVLAAGSVLNRPMHNDRKVYGGAPAKEIGEVKITSF
ncbi:hypothetical protein [uncultured Halomonas sp.]|uniref:acyltransferase n=1 Tax=uncultured Halomonas sp. TaxID=173971 RepID=UPI00262CC177|nr:hypothetical protein [uncultured Halomonas sp.]